MSLSELFKGSNMVAPEKMIEKETKHADEIHRILFDKIDDIKNILLKK